MGTPPLYRRTTAWRFFNSAWSSPSPKIKCLPHRQAPRPSELEPEVALRNRCNPELELEALRDKEKRRPPARQLPDPVPPEPAAVECGRSTLMIHPESKLGQFPFWSCRCCSSRLSSCRTSGESTLALKNLLKERTC